MTLLKQCEIWNETEEYEKIVEAIQKLPSSEMTPETDIELARAYNNLGAYAIEGDEVDEDLLCKAVDLLKKHEDLFKTSYKLNFRLGYAYYYLDDLEDALYHFKEASKIKPDDEDSQMFISQIEKTMRHMNSKPQNDDHVVLLEKAVVDYEKLIEDLKIDWDIMAEKDEDGDISIKTEDRSIYIVFSKDKGPVDELEFYAETNFLWDEAESKEVIEKHQAYLHIVSRGYETPAEHGMTLTKIVLSCLKQEGALAVYVIDSVLYSKEQYLFAEKSLFDGNFPIHNLIWINFYRSDNGICAYTSDMKKFGKTNFEVIDSLADLDVIHSYLINIASYVIENDIEFSDGETFGYSSSDTNRLTLSEGISLEEQTFKLELPPKKEEIIFS